MTEKLLEKKICQECSANVRPGAHFCYSCGSPYMPDLIIETEADTSPYKTGSLNRNGNKNNNETALPDAPPSRRTTADLPIGKPSETLLSVAAPIEKTAPDKTSSVRQEAGAKKTAQPPRPRSRFPEGGRVEVIWEEPADSTNVWFVAVSIGLALLAVGIVMAALYMR